MKAPVVVATLLGLLSLTGCQSPTDTATGPSASATAPTAAARKKLPQGTIDELVQRTREVLPKAWAVNYDAEHQWLEIERTAPISAPAAGTQVTKATIGLRAVPYLDPEKWEKRRAALTRRLLAIKHSLSPRTGKDETTGRLIAATADEKPKVAEYNALLDEFHALPDYRYHDVGFNLVWQDGSLIPFAAVMDDAERQECRTVLDAFTGLLTVYEAPYEGVPYSDAARPKGGPQRIPGAVFCAYYDEGDEGIAFHDSDRINRGSGLLNPADGTYRNEFRRLEALDVSYTKQENDLDSPCNRVKPPLGLLYVGWNEPGEWFSLTVETAAAGNYTADLLYTAQRDGQISITVDGSEKSIPIASTADPRETIPWRQWHHWAVARDAVTLALPKGRSVLTVHIVSGGNMNLATLLFRPAGTPRSGPDITTYNTPVP